jgi:hypothetical protein
MCRSRDLLVASQGQKALLLERPEQHRLFFHPELAHFVQEEQAFIRAEQQPGPIADRAGERALDVTEEGRHGRVAADRRTIDLHEWTGDETPGLLQFVDASRQERLASPGRPEEQNRRRRSHRHPVQAFHDLVERCAARRNAGLEE